MDFWIVEIRVSDRYVLGSPLKLDPLAIIPPARTGNINVKIPENIIAANTDSEGHFRISGKTAEFPDNDNFNELDEVLSFSGVASTAPLTDTEQENVYKEQIRNGVEKWIRLMPRVEYYGSMLKHTLYHDVSEEQFRTFYTTAPRKRLALMLIAAGFMWKDTDLTGKKALTEYIVEFDSGALLLQSNTQYENELHAWVSLTHSEEAPISRWLTWLNSDWSMFLRPDIVARVQHHEVNNVQANNTFPDENGNARFGGFTEGSPINPIQGATGTGGDTETQSDTSKGGTGTTYNYSGYRNYDINDSELNSLLPAIFRA